MHAPPLATDRADDLRNAVAGRLLEEANDDPAAGERSERGQGEDGRSLQPRGEQLLEAVGTRMQAEGQSARE
jgi:hypothetical protein